MMPIACFIRVHGVVQGVGFRPFVYRLAREKTLAGWVLNGDQGVEIHLEGDDRKMEAFVREMRSKAPAAASISDVEVEPALCEGLAEFTIREGDHAERPTVRISPDLPICEDCLRECFDPENPRYEYPYINCTNCGPRYSVVIALPYDRVKTTMRAWPLDAYCDTEYQDPANRRFHAQSVACPTCGPNISLVQDHVRVAEGSVAIGRAAELLSDGKIVAVKGLGDITWPATHEIPSQIPLCVKESTGRRSLSRSWRRISRLHANCWISRLTLRRYLLPWLGRLCSHRRESNLRG